jgi:hypothetical protein
MLKNEHNRLSSRGGGSHPGQLIWGLTLVFAGFGVFYRIPQVMPKIEQIQQFSSATGVIRFCFYVIGIILIGGGLKKIVNHFKAGKRSE